MCSRLGVTAEGLHSSTSSRTKRYRSPQLAISSHVIVGGCFSRECCCQAENAAKALASTHLYGRHLVIEFAKADATLAELQERAKRQLNDVPTESAKRKKQKGTLAEETDRAFSSAFQDF